VRLRAVDLKDSVLLGGETQEGKEHDSKAVKREGMERDAPQVLSAW